MDRSHIAVTKGDPPGGIPQVWPPGGDPKLGSPTSLVKVKSTRRGSHGRPAGVFPQWVARDSPQGAGGRFPQRVSPVSFLH
jgi:hypothetical protein